MSEHEEKLKEKIRNAPHQSKPKEASLVVYDREGRWLFEVYGVGPLKLSSSRTGENTGQCELIGLLGSFPAPEFA
jgi:hypothetical protein